MFYLNRSVYIQKIQVGHDVFHSHILKGSMMQHRGKHTKMYSIVIEGISASIFNDYFLFSTKLSL